MKRKSKHSDWFWDGADEGYLRRYIYPLLVGDYQAYTIDDARSGFDYAGVILGCFYKVRLN